MQSLLHALIFLKLREQVKQLLGPRIYKYGIYISLLLELQILNNRLRLMVLIYLQWKNLGNHFALERFAKVLSGLILTVKIY